MPHKEGVEVDLGLQVGPLFEVYLLLGVFHKSGVLGSLLKNQEIGLHGFGVLEEGHH